MRQAATSVVLKDFRSAWEDFLCAGSRVVDLWMEVEDVLNQEQGSSWTHPVRKYPENLPSFDDLMAELGEVEIKG